MHSGPSGPLTPANTAVPSSGYMSVAATAPAVAVAAAPASVAASDSAAAATAASAASSATVFSSPIAPAPVAAAATTNGAAPASSVGSASLPVPHTTASGKWPAASILLSALCFCITTTRYKKMEKYTSAVRPTRPLPRGPFVNLNSKTT